MSKRITFMMDDAVIKKARKYQAQEIARTENNVPFSSIINEAIKAYFK